jgi:hypothetical protein
MFPIIAQKKFANISLPYFHVCKAKLFQKKTKIKNDILFENPYAKLLFNACANFDETGFFFGKKKIYFDKTLFFFDKNIHFLSRNQSFI